MSCQAMLARTADVATGHLFRPLATATSSLLDTESFAVLAHPGARPRPRPSLTGFLMLVQRNGLEWCLCVGTASAAPTGQVVHRQAILIHQTVNLLNCSADLHLTRLFQSRLQWFLLCQQVFACGRSILPQGNRKFATGKLRKNPDLMTRLDISVVMYTSFKYGSCRELR